MEDSIFLGKQTLREFEIGALSISLFTSKSMLPRQISALWSYFLQLKHTTCNPSWFLSGLRPNPGYVTSGSLHMVHTDHDMDLTQYHIGVMTLGGNSDPPFQIECHLFLIFSQLSLDKYSCPSRTAIRVKVKGRKL